jgi:Leucine-rich repeat (LRR) protein
VHKLNIGRLEYYAGSQELVFPIELLDSHKTLEELSIVSSDLSQLPGNFVPILRTLKLKTLDLESNGIGSAEPFVDLPMVERIDLFSNRIEELPANSFSGCPKLTHLSLQANPISTFRGDEFDQLTVLKELDLKFTVWTSLAPNTFHALTSLEKLDMKYSFGGSSFIVEKELFMNLRNLEVLDLFYGKIHAIHPEAFDNLGKLTILDMRTNRCMSKDFTVQPNGTLDLEIVKGELKTCFDNYRTGAQWTGEWK